MQSPDLPDPADAGEVLLDREEGTTVLYRGLLISTWRTWMRPDLLVAAIGAIEAGAARHPEGVGIVSIHQVDRKFPIGMGFTSNLVDITRQLAKVRPSIRALAVVVEFDGFLATTFRLAVRAVLAGGAPSLEAKVFTSRIEAFAWMREREPERLPTLEALRGAIDAARFTARRASD